jgi:hypothetical protein
MGCRRDCVAEAKMLEPIVVKISDILFYNHGSGERSVEHDARIVVQSIF